MCGNRALSHKITLHHTTNLRYTICDVDRDKSVIRTGNSIVYKASVGVMGTDRKDFYALKGAAPGKDILREASAYFAIDPDEVGDGVMLLRDVVPSEAGPLLVTDWAGKGTVADWIAKTATLRQKNASVDALLMRRGVELVLQASRGLRALHELTPRPLVHQDVKPSNLLLFDGDFVQVADFGLVVAGDDDGVLGGTRGYMSPEQTIQLELRRYEHATAGVRLPDLASCERATAVGKEVGPPCDVWALGMVLADVLGGSIAEAAAEYRRKVCHVSTTVSHADPDATLRDTVDQAHAMASSASAIVDAVRSFSCEDERGNLKAVAELLGQCFEVDPEARPSMKTFQAMLAKWCVCFHPHFQTATLWL